MKKVRRIIFGVLCSFMMTGSVLAQSVTSFTLVDSDTNLDIKTLVDGDTIFLDQHVNIRANTDGPVSEVKFLVNGSPYSLEKVPPFALAGDSNGDYNEWNKSLGEYTVEARPNSVGPGTFVSFVVINRSQFTLVDAENDSDLFPLYDGAIIDLACLHTDKLNIRFDTYFENTQSVYFDFSESQFNRFENQPPYALFTDINGDYNAWCCPEPGCYYLFGTPYTGHNGAGVAGPTYGITFYIIDGWNLRSAALNTYPNPVEDRLGIDLSGAEVSEVVITDLNGKEYFSGTVNVDQASNIDLSSTNMRPGIYLVKATNSQGTKVSKIIKK
jgi:hypothetical protein